MDEAVDTNAPYVAGLDAFTRFMAGEGTDMLDLQTAAEILSIALASVTSAANGSLFQLP